MEKKPNKKEELTLVNNVLKLATKLLKVCRIKHANAIVTDTEARRWLCVCPAGVGRSVSTVRSDHEPSAVQHHSGGHPVGRVGSHQWPAGLQPEGQSRRRAPLLCVSVNAAASLTVCVFRSQLWKIKSWRRIWVIPASRGDACSCPTHGGAVSPRQGLPDHELLTLLGHIRVLVQFSYLFYPFSVSFLFSSICFSCYNCFKYYFSSGCDALIGKLQQLCLCFAVCDI